MKFSKILEINNEYKSIHELHMYGDVLKKIRSKLGVTQKEFSEMIGIDRITLSNIEVNNRIISKNAAKRVDDFIKERKIDIQ